MSHTTKPTKAPKPIAPIHAKLRLMWGLWLFYRLVVYVGLMGLSTQANVLYGVLWQIVVLLPAFAFTPAIMQAKNAYRLIVASMVMLIYLASVGVFFVVRLYENAPTWVAVGLGFETVLLVLINVLLMVLIKRLPPMHKGGVS